MGGGRTFKYLQVRKSLGKRVLAKKIGLQRGYRREGGKKGASLKSTKKTGWTKERKDMGVVLMREIINLRRE